MGSQARSAESAEVWFVTGTDWFCRHLVVLSRSHKSDCDHVTTVGVTVTVTAMIFSDRSTVSQVTVICDVTPVSPKAPGMVSSLLFFLAS